MKSTTKKQQFNDDFKIIERIHWDSFALISRLSMIALLFFSSSLLLPSNAFSVASIDKQIPVKKVVVTTKKSTSSKVVKGKSKSSKRKKRTVAKKDSLQDIDPTTTSSPLYKN